MSDENKNFGDKAEDAFDKAKEAANEFKDDVKQTFSADNPDQGKTVAIVAHLTVIGFVVALILNGQNRTEFGVFYLRQLLGLWIIGLVLGFIPIVGCFSAVAVLIFVIMSLINAINGNTKPVPLVGTYFQDWFKGVF